MIVYKLTNLDNGKIYIGQTKFSLEKRFKEHAKADSYLGYAIRQHGEDHFKREVLATCETREEAYALEIRYIAEFDCMAPNGYNLTPGGAFDIKNLGTQNGDGWMLVYRDTFMKFLLTAPDFITTKVFGSLMTKQEYENGARTTKKAVADELKISYRSVISAFNWLKEHDYIKERKVNGQTEFLLNPDVTTCGKNKKKKVDLWNSL